MYVETDDWSIEIRRRDGSWILDTTGPLLSYRDKDAALAWGRQLTSVYPVRLKHVTITTEDVTAAHPHTWPEPGQMHEHDGFAPHSHEVRPDHRGVQTSPGL